MKRIVTSKNPDADALVAAWLAASQLFDGESCAVFFVNGKRSVANLQSFDCAIGVPGAHDPSCLSFNAKSPGPEQNETCVTRLIWEYLLAEGKPLEHLAKLVAIMEEGKRNAAESSSESLQSSRTHGLHAFVQQQKAMVPDDHALFRAVCRWLHSYECAVLRSCRSGLSSRANEPATA